MVVEVEEVLKTFDNIRDAFARPLERFDEEVIAVWNAMRMSRGRPRGVRCRIYSSCIVRRKV